MNHGRHELDDGRGAGSAAPPHGEAAGRRRVPWGIWLALVLWLAVDAWILLRAEPPWVTAVELAQNEADGVRPHWTTQAAPGIWWAAAITAVLALLLAATARLWALPVAGSGATSPTGRVTVHQPLGSARQMRWFWAGLMALVVLASVIRLPLASGSLWWDEAWAVKQASHGQWREDRRNPGELRFVETTWDRAAWYFLKPTNHPTASLAQKASFDTWRKLTGAERHEFNDLAARMPALLASGLAVFAVGALLKTWGMPVAGLLAAALLGLHPWAIRYGVDTRAYALLLPLVPLALLWITRLHRQPWRWRWWALLALTQFLMLWTFPNALPVALALFLTTALVLWHRLPDRDQRWQAWGRLTAVHVLAAMAFLHAFLPNLMQALRWGPDPQLLLSWPVLRDTFTGLALGVPYRASEAGSLAVDWAGLRDAHWWTTAWAWCNGIAALLGIWALWHRSRVGLAAIGSIVLLSATYVAVSWWRGIYFYPRYLMPLLPLLIMLVAIGWTQSAAWLARQVRADAMPIAGAVGAFAMVWFTALAWPQVHLLTVRPISPMHDTVQWIRQQPGGENGVIIAYGLGGRVLDVYAPDAVLAHDRPTIEDGLRAAGERRQSAWLVRGYDPFDRRHMPGGFELIDDPQWFEFLQEFDGIEPQFQYRVYRAVQR